VTTTMLWIGGQISTAEIIKGLWIASTVNLVLPLVLASFFLKGELCLRTGSKTTASPPPGSKKI